MGNLVSPSADEPDNRRAPTSTAELPTERDNDAGPALGARSNQEREPAARHTSMEDIHSATAEISGVKKKRRKKIEITGQKYNGLPYYIGRP